MISVILVTLLLSYMLGIEMIRATTCHFSRADQFSPSGWFDVIDECKGNANDTICFSAYNPRKTYYHVNVGWWHVLHTEDECLTKQYLRERLGCSDEQETPAEGCYRDKKYYKNFFLCWCTGSKCNTRKTITQIYGKPNTIFVVDGNCIPLKI